MNNTEPGKPRAQLLRHSRRPSVEVNDLSWAVSLEQIAQDEDVVVMLVDRLYERLRKSPRLQMYFLNVDMGRLRIHQAHFMMQIFSGMGQGKLHTIRAVHQRLVEKLSLGQEDFNEFCELATGVMVEARLPPGLVDEFERRIEIFRPWVLGLPETRRKLTLKEFLELTRPS